MGRKWGNKIGSLHSTPRYFSKIKCLCWRSIISRQTLSRKIQRTRKNGNYHIDFKSSDETVTSIDATETKVFNEISIFGTLENASKFFENGDLGYLPNKDKFDGLRLKAYKWEVKPLEVSNVKSSFLKTKKFFQKVP